MDTQADTDKVILGHLISSYGVQGWIKVYSYTDPIANILSYSPWYIKSEGKWQPIKVEASKPHAKGLIAKLTGIDSPEVAKTYNGVEIAVDASVLPELAKDEIYWSQLYNLDVYTESGELLGKVDHLLETGANDVLVVKGTEESVDRNERLIPYVLEQVIKEIDLETGKIRVDWDPEF